MKTLGSVLRLVQAQLTQAQHYDGTTRAQLFNHLLFIPMLERKASVLSQFSRLPQSTYSTHYILCNTLSKTTLSCSFPTPSLQKDTVALRIDVSGIM
jgi:hypothetical protein